ncbi:MAG TPA: hypothetical protein VIT23_01090 [Terrimicrobiaceae bacterium]
MKRLLVLTVFLTGCVTRTDNMEVRRAVALTHHSLERSLAASKLLKQHVNLAASYQERIDSKTILLLDQWKDSR